MKTAALLVILTSFMKIDSSVYGRHVDSQETAGAMATGGRRATARTASDSREGTVASNLLPSGAVVVNTPGTVVVSSEATPARE